MRDSKNSEMKKMLAGTIALLMVVASVGVYQKWFSKTSKFDEDHIGECYYQEIQEEHVATDDLTMYTDNEILLVTEDGVKKRAVEKLAKKYDAEIVGRIEQTGDYQLQLSNVYSLEELEQLSEDLKAEDIVASADINYIFDAEPSDVESSSESFQYGKEWAGDLSNSTDCAGKSWGFEMIQAQAAWELLKEHSDQVNQDLRIGLIDGGFDDNHKDLGFAETFYNQNISEDDKKHGTHVAGIMAAKSDNEAGICGVYPFADGHLYGVSYRGIDNTKNLRSVISDKYSLSELILRNVKVVNCSFNYEDYGVLATAYNEIGAQECMTHYAKTIGDFLQKLLDIGYDFCIIQSAGNSSN
ncbi:MAG: S8 family serine peptidase [Ruminococcus sp.]